MNAANNIRVGQIDLQDPELRRVIASAELSGAHSMIRELSNGYETVLSPRFQGGIDLSGGQWQRVGVARGAYRRAGFMVADEPTASLDAHAEREVLKRLCGAPSGVYEERTTLLITHRLANIQCADRIIVLEGGRVVESGTHDELMASGGPYSRMYLVQAEPFDYAV
jgi:ATP-binding cassette subfamily B protein